MNVYFVYPTYVKPEVWKPLLSFLKVKAIYCLIPKEDLPNGLYSTIKTYLKGLFSKEGDMLLTSNYCVYWLRSHFEKHIRLLSNDHDDTNKVPKEIKNKFSSNDALVNLQNLDDENCLILLNKKSGDDFLEAIMKPGRQIHERQNFNLPTHILKYCLNILHKQYGHYQYSYQSAFIRISPYFSSASFFDIQLYRWCRFDSLTTDKQDNFICALERGINAIAPDLFPIEKVEGKEYFTSLLTAEGEVQYNQYLKMKEEQEKEELEQFRIAQEEANFDDYVKECNREFWEECGEAGSNCESWPGWD